MECVCHVITAPAKVETVMRIATLEKKERLLKFAREWSRLDKQPELEIALQIISNNSEHISEDSVYHQSCFLRFASSSHVEKASKSKRKRPICELPDTHETTETVLKSKFTRSKSAGLGQVKASSSSTVLPRVCIICCKTRKQKGGKTEPLSSVQTFTVGSTLLEAATFNNDERLLVLLNSAHDLTAAEAIYHNSCRTQYIRQHQRDVEKISSVAKKQDLNWKQFCEKAIDCAIIEKRGKQRMVELVRQYTKMFPGDEHGSSWMKYRLQRDYSEILMVHPSTDPRVSELVTRKDALLTEIVDPAQIVTPRGQLSSTSTGTDPHSSFESSDEQTWLNRISQHENSYLTTDTKVEMYHSALALKAAIGNSQVTINHPPTTSDLSYHNAREAVPPQLFNFMCVMTGLIEEFPDELTEYASVENSEKIMSICQDVVGCSGKTSPKALALGLTIRHATGSKYLVNLLHGMGHASSYDKVLRAETALAKQQSANQDHSYVPEGFRYNQPTVLVYDNIDFQEETLSGAGTSHYTNGIMFQLAHTESAVSVSRNIAVPRSKKTFTPTKQDIPAFHLFKKNSPHQNSIASLDMQSFQHSILTDQSYLLLKLRDGPSLGTWTGINITTTKPLETSVIHYLPIIEASPTDIATVKHVLTEAIKMADTMQCPSVIVVFDQATYCKAQMIRWEDESIRDRLLPRLGELHTIMSYLSAVGKRFQHSGLEDILVEAEVVAGGSLKGVISGHMYNRAIRAHKLMFEALGILQLKEYVETCETNQLEQLADAIDMMELRLSQGLPLSSNPSNAFLADFQKHITKRCAESPLYAFWNSYIQMITVVLGFIRATRIGDFTLHLSCLRQMLPWFFAYDRVNYARYGTVYWMEMCDMENSHPWLFSQLETNPGAWTYQRQSERGFNGLAADQTIETTVNRESKTPGGVTGITMNQGALQRWLLSKPAKAAISAECDTMAGLHHSFSAHTELDAHRIRKDEKSVNALIEAVLAMVNPFATSITDLVSLSSGALANKDTKSDLLAAESVGEEKLKLFMKERIVGKDTDYFAAIKSSKLKTFASSTKKPIKKAELMSVRSDRSLFMQLLLVAKERNVDMRSILCYTLSPVPGCFSGLDQTSISKTTKSSLLKHLEDLVPNSLVTEKPKSCAVVIDAMALIQSLTSSQIPNKFGDLADVIFKRILQIAAQFNASRVDFVGDRYDNISIKGLERQRRNQTAQTYTISRADQKLPVQWKVFLSSGASKQSLQSFLAQHFHLCKSQTPITVITALQKNVIRLIYEPGELPTAIDVNSLLSDHEEADTRLILHAKNCSLDYDKVIVWSPDTDVAVIGIGHAHTIDCELLFATGTGKNKRILSLTKIASHTQPMARVLPAFHALTGCDTTSSFYGKGKKSTYNILKEKPDLIAHLSSLGTDFAIKSLPKGIEELVCAIYNCKTETVNEARFEVFKTGSSEKALPPTSDALQQHLRRANYQAKIWKSALVPMMACPTADGHGWTIEDGVLSITWLEGDYAPKAILKTTKCKCATTGCKTARCVCKKEGLRCTALCGCKDCANHNQSESLESEDDEEDSDVDIDER